MTDHLCDVLVIGAGPAGLTAAIYAGRAALRVLVLAGEPTSSSDQPGGQLMLTTDVENYPGFPSGVQGPQLVENLREQAERFGASVLGGKVTGAVLDESPFTVEVSTGDTVTAHAVIVASGSATRMLGLADEARLLAHGVSTCATCDGFFFRGQQIAVVGGGDSALEEALFLTKFAESVTVIHRRDKLRASKILQERAQANPRISFRWNSEVAGLSGGDILESLQVRDVQTGDVEDLAVTGLFLAIGHLPNSSVFGGKLALDDHGYIVTTPGRTQTSVPGVFAAGDVQDPVYRQAITAAASGCMAAIDVERWLESRPHRQQPADSTRVRSGAPS